MKARAWKDIRLLCDLHILLNDNIPESSMTQL